MTDVTADSIMKVMRKQDPSRSLTEAFLPEPLPRERLFQFISVDDHVVEAPDMFEGRLPLRTADRAPRVVGNDDGSQAWLIDGELNPYIGLSAVVGRPHEDYDMQPTRFEQMRPGCYIPRNRVADMDTAGILASVCFPNALAGFCGLRFAEVSDHELGLDLVRAWNDWILTEWVNPYPDRFIACQLPWLNDPAVAASEIYANADKGFKAVTFCEAPQQTGRPSLHSGWWDPFLAACEETETVVCLHIGSSSVSRTSAEDAPHEVLPILGPLNAYFAAVDWLYARVPVKFPTIKIALSEGGISWVPGLIDRLDHSYRQRQYQDKGWSTDKTATPSDILRRNFWFCAIDDPAGFELRHRIGVDHILLESDYPHADSTWPDTQAVIASQLAGLSDEEIRMVTHGNAASLFRHEI